MARDAGRGHGRRPGRLAALGLPLWGLVALLAGGCESGNVIEISDPEQFRREVLECEQPVLVNFYKGGCPTCLPLDPIFVQLSKEYEGRAKITRFMIMTPWWSFPYWNFKQEHQIYFVPEVLLFHKGVEVKRWPMMYFIDPYRNALNKLVPPPGAGPMPAAAWPSAAAPPRLTPPPPPATTPPAPVRPPAGERVP